MKNLIEYINEVSRDLVFRAYNKASGVQKKRIKKLYNELYDADDDLTDKNYAENKKIRDQFKEARQDLESLVWDFTKKLESVYKKYKKSNPDDVYGIVGGSNTLGHESGVTFGAEPTRNRPNMLFGVRGKTDIIDKIKEEVNKKVNLQKEFQRIANDYSDILKYEKPTGEASYWATYVSTIRPKVPWENLIVNTNPNVYFLYINEIRDYVKKDNDGYGILTLGIGDDHNDTWWIFCNDIINKYLRKNKKK